jgi:hypothetical protein
MIELAGVAKSHRMIVAGCDSSEVLLELHRRGYSRAAATRTCSAPRSQNQVPLIVWREHPIRALATTLNWLVHFLSPAGVLVVWVGPHERVPSQALRLELEKLGFRIGHVLRNRGCHLGAAACIRVARVAPQGVDRLVPDHVHHLEQRRAPCGCGRLESRRKGRTTRARAI